MQGLPADSDADKTAAEASDGLLLVAKQICLFVNFAASLPNKLVCCAGIPSRV